MSRTKELIKSHLANQKSRVNRKVFQEQEGEVRLSNNRPFDGYHVGAYGNGNICGGMVGDCQDRRNSVGYRQARASWFRARNSNANRWNCLKNPGERWR